MIFKKYFSIAILILISFIPLLDLFHSGLPITHDGQDHIARIANFYQNLQEGNIIPRWAGNLNWGYGHPILMFLYPLSSYIASFFHFLGFSLVDSTKLFFGLAFILSGITMYLWIQSFLGKNAGFVAGVLYMFAPYRFVDLYVRGAIGEHLAFMFPPLVLYFLLKLTERFSKWYIFGGALSLAGLLLSHNAISLMFMPIIILYALYLLFTSEESRSLPRHLRGGVAPAAYIGGVVSIMLLGLGISAFFWIPAFFEGKYTLRNIVTANEYASRFSDFRNFLFGQWSYRGTDYLSKQVGVIQWILTITSLPIGVFLYKKKNNKWIVIAILFLLFWFTIFLMTPMSKLVWDKLTVLQKFQFPWRFLSLTVFIASVLGGMVISVIAQRFRLLTVLILIVSLIFFNKDYWRANGYLYKDDSFFSGIYSGTTDTGESSPIWSVRFMEKKPKKHMEVVSGEAVIKELSRKSTVHVYEIDVSKKSRILENTLYFPGWNILVDKKVVDIEFQDPKNRGLITFFVEKGDHEVSIKFSETKLRLFVDTITAATLAIIIFLLLASKSLHRSRSFLK